MGIVGFRNTDNNYHDKFSNTYIVTIITYEYSVYKEKDSLMMLYVVKFMFLYVGTRVLIEKELVVTGLVTTADECHDLSN